MKGRVKAQKKDIPKGDELNITLSTDRESRVGVTRGRGLLRGSCLGEVEAAKDRRLHAEKTWPSYTAKQMGASNPSSSMALLVDIANSSGIDQGCYIAMLNSPVLATRSQALLSLEDGTASRDASLVRSLLSKADTPLPAMYIYLLTTSLSRESLSRSLFPVEGE